MVMIGAATGILVWPTLRVGHTAQPCGCQTEQGLMPLDQPRKFQRDGRYGGSDRSIGSDLLSLPKNLGLLSDDCILRKLGELSKDDRLSVVLEWVKGSEESLAFFLRQRNDPLIIGIFSKAIEMWTNSHPSRVIPSILAISDSENLGEIALGAFLELGHLDHAEKASSVNPSAASKYATVRTINDSDFDYADYIETLFNSEDRTCFEAAVDSLALIKSNDIGEFQDFLDNVLANKWYTRDTLAVAASLAEPHDFLEWLSKSEVPLEIANAVAPESFRSLLDKDIVTAADWINENPSSPFRDVIVVELCRSLATVDPDAAVAWAATIRSDRQRELATEPFGAFEQP